ncbi:transcription factor subunit Med10 of mediator complex-domain-containing protein [Absidia repens]|uniref:Mediator of RNA polymerase II transcription subunit 10 n=1 Tax=Absidia repens TaxID=90262 RepID=A0A1X2J2L9_9FUNG|nr:transcription factor subunit Med10 of mediator complex-domain-containing protein [Absidia repens]
MISSLMGISLFGIKCKYKKANDIQNYISLLTYLMFRRFVHSNSVLEHYKTIDDLKNGLNKFIPEEVINYVENGQNPDLFTQAFVSRTATENQFTNGKIQAVDNFRSLLSDEFAKSFPDLYENNNDLDSPYIDQQQQETQQAQGQQESSAPSSSTSTSI